MPHRFSKFQAFFVAVSFPPDVHSKTVDTFLFLAEIAILDKAVGSGNDILNAWHIVHENTSPGFFSVSTF